MSSLITPEKRFSSAISLSLLIVLSSFSSASAQRGKPVNIHPEELLHNCSDMQEVFNEITWNKDTKFEGFDQLEFSSTTNYFTGKITNSCSGGYIVENSPLGKRICIGQIQQTWWEKYDYKWYFGSNGYGRANDNCRWKD
jgi:hypothetical protein